MSSSRSAAATAAVGRLADDRQDRALDRLGDRAVGRPRALRQRVGEVEAVEPALAAEALGHAPEDLAGDDARVAAGAHQRPEADRGRDPLGRLAGGRLGLVERGPDRGEHVRAGVAVGDRVDVEAVDLVDVGLEVGDGRPERLEQPGAVAGRGAPSGDVRPAVGEVARSDAVGSRGAIGGRLAGRLDAQAVDVDHQSADLAVERAAERVADRGIDLAGDLGDRHAEGDVEVELEVAARRRDGRAMPGWARPRRPGAAERPAGEPGDAVRAERRGRGRCRRRRGGSRASGRASARVGTRATSSSRVAGRAAPSLGAGGRVLSYRPVRARPARALPSEPL